MNTAAELRFVHFDRLFSRTLTIQLARSGKCTELPTASHCLLKCALDSRPLKVLTNQKPLVYALHAVSDRYRTREIRYLEFGSQFTYNM